MNTLEIKGRVGRPSSGVDRKVQLANAQKKKREEDKKEGLKPINVVVSGEAKNLFNALCEIHKKTQREIMEELINKAIRNGSLL